MDAKEKERLIFHVDVNSAFLSWESARRVKNGEEDLRLIPAAIGGDKDKRTAVILAKSIPAKKYGINTGEPVSMALRKCPSLVLAKPDFTLYTACSKAFMSICREYAPVVEKFSIDECFLDMTGTDYLYPDPVALAHTIKDRIKNELGFTVNIGIGSNKLLAKMASDFEKPDKVHTLFTGEIEKKLWPLSVGELLFVGKNSADRLRSAGINTVGDAAGTDIARLQRILGMKMGQMVFEYSHGIDTTPVTSERAEAKGFSISTTLEENVTDTETALNIIRMLCESIAERMRQDGFRAYCIGVTIRSREFKNRSHQKKLINATDITEEIFAESSKLFVELWDRETPLRLLGVSLTSLTKEDTVQLSLFENQEETDRKRNVNKALDDIRKKYGSGIIKRASSMDEKLEVGKKYRAEIENRDE